MNYNNSLQYIRSPFLQNTFDYIRSSNHHSTSSNIILHNNTNLSHFNNYALRLNSSNDMNDNYSNIHQNILSWTNTNEQRYNSDTYISQEANTNDATNPTSNNINSSHHQHLQTNTFRKGLTFDNELTQEINLNNIPQSLDN